MTNLLRRNPREVARSRANGVDGQSGGDVGLGPVLDTDADHQFPGEHTCDRHNRPAAVLRRAGRRSDETIKQWHGCQTEFPRPVGAAGQASLSVLQRRLGLRIPRGRCDPRRSGARSTGGAELRRRQKRDDIVE